MSATPRAMSGPTSRKLKPARGSRKLNTPSTATTTMEPTTKAVRISLIVAERLGRARNAPHGTHSLVTALDLAQLLEVHDLSEASAAGDAHSRSLSRRRKATGAPILHDMSERSAALAVVRRGRSGIAEVLLVHPGGPFFANKDAGAWSLPKGLLEPGEDPLTAARREFEEETGSRAPDGPATPLGEVTLKSGKHVVAFGVLGDFEVATLRSNEVEVNVRGRLVRFPEVDRAEWANLERARIAVNPAQLPLVEKALSLFC